MDMKKLVFLSLLSSIGIVLGAFESMMPLPLLIPGIRLGLSNIVVLVTLTTIGVKESLLVGIFKSLVLSLITGSVTSLFYSLTGICLSVLVMHIVNSKLSNVFSLIGVSLWGAIFHSIGQILVASIILSNIKMIYYLPIMLIFSTFTGCFVGLATSYIGPHLEKIYKQVID